MRQSPEIQSMYSLNMPVSKIRTKVRQEFEKHRYVKNIQAVDVLLTQSHAEFQVRFSREGLSWDSQDKSGAQDRAELTREQETLNFWKQNSDIMKYLRVEEDENARLPKNFVSGFLEV